MWHRSIDVGFFLLRSQRNSLLYRVSCSLINTRTKEFLSSQTQNMQFIAWVLFPALKWKYSSCLKRISPLNPNKLSNFLKKAVCWNALFLSVISMAYPLVADMGVYFSNVSPGNIKIKHFIIHLPFIFFSKWCLCQIWNACNSLLLLICQYINFSW